MATRDQTILIVDDDPDLRDLIKMVLEENGFKTAEAENGKEAQSLIMSENYSAIISDVQMPVMNGIELLQFVKKTKSVPFILITGFSDIMEAKQAYDLGASDFITKPFKGEEIIDILNKILGDGFTPPKADVDQDSLYCKVNITEFLTGKDLKYDLYIRLSSKKYLKIAHKGAIMDPARIKEFQAKGLENLALTKEDFSQYVGLSLQLSNRAQNSSDLSHSKKLWLLKHTTEVILEQTRVYGLRERDFEAAKGTVEGTMSLILEDKNFSQLVQMLNTHSDFLYSHSIGVSLYSSLIAREASWSSTTTLVKVSMGGLFHDIGKKELDRTLLEKPRIDYTADEVKTYESHPARGREILTRIPAIPEDVTYIAMYHHENMQGTGFPYRIRRENLHPLAKLVAVADEFCNLVLKTPSGPGMPPHQAIERMIMFKGDDFDPIFLRLLTKIFDVPMSAQYLDFFKKHKVA